MTGIYSITNKVNGKQYVGQSVDIENRWRTHKYYALNREKEHDFYLYRAMRKYGLDNFKFEVLEECARELLTERENHYIVKLNTKSPHGYNMVYAHQNPMHDPLIRKKHLCAVQSQKHRNKMSKIMSEVTRTQEYRANMSERMKSAKGGVCYRSGESNPMWNTTPKWAKQVIMIDPIHHTPIKTFKSSRHAFDFIRAIGLTQAKGCGTAIRSCARGNLSTAYKHKWEFVKESEVMPFCQNN